MIEQRIEALTEVRDTLLRIRNEGLVEELNMLNYHSDCGTVNCVAGWRQMFVHGRQNSDEAEEWSYETVTSFPDLIDIIGENIYWRVLFGECNGSGLKAWEQQMRRTNWLLEREKRRLEWERIPDLSKAERREVYANLRAAA